MRRRIALALIAAVAAGIAPPSAPAFASPRHLVGVYPGHDSRKCAAEVQITSLQKFEACIGRAVDIVRDFHGWTKEDVFPSRLEAYALETGHAVLTSLNPVMRQKRPATWRSIARGERNTTIDLWAKALKSATGDVYFTFNHEPEDDIDTHGTPAQFVAAWRYIKDRFTKLGVTNVKYVWTMMGYTWQASDRRPRDYWVGSSYTDYIGANGYNWGYCKGTSGWRSMARMYDPVYEWGIKKGKPMMATELGSAEDKSWPGRKGGWFNGMRKWLANHPKFVSVIYYNKRRECRWPIDSSQTALDAYKRYAAWAARTSD